MLIGLLFFLGMEASFEAGRMIKERPRERDDDRPARAAEQMGPARSADRETGGAGGVPQVEMNPAVQKVVHVESLSLTLAGNSERYGHCPALPAASPPASRVVRWANDPAQT